MNHATGSFSPVKYSKPYRYAKQTLSFSVDNWLVIGFGVAAVLGYFFPRTYTA